MRCGDAAGEQISLMFAVLGDTYPQKQIVKFEFLGNFCILGERYSTFGGPGLPYALVRRGGGGCMQT